MAEYTNEKILGFRERVYTRVNGSKYCFWVLCPKVHQGGRTTRCSQMESCHGVPCLVVTGYQSKRTETQFVDLLDGESPVRGKKKRNGNGGGGTARRAATLGLKERGLTSGGGSLAGSLASGGGSLGGSVAGSLANGGGLAKCATPIDLTDETEAMSDVEMKSPGRASGAATSRLKKQATCHLEAVSSNLAQTRIIIATRQKVLQEVCLGRLRRVNCSSNSTTPPHIF